MSVQMYRSCLRQIRHGENTAYLIVSARFACIHENGMPTWANIWQAFRVYLDTGIIADVYRIVIYQTLHSTIQTLTAPGIAAYYERTCFPLY
jgi:hypothetical protein